MTDVEERLRALPGLLPCTSGPAPEADIARAEETLGLRFAEDYRMYVTAIGEAYANGHELTGVCPFPQMDVVAVTQEERRRNPDVPADWYVVEQANIDRIVVWQDASGAVWQTIPGAGPARLADSLLDYLAD